ncbi:MFS monosaccharide transporter [Colletotrichum karsti]|uniref:MFS monosaccharide transporter n=1 Tax=Colletotrichum karsti TaxID=1095194 RepID=A0A9P6I0T8_9PEZI|nr:MFS monosaccharide transporter [Colletotrichum karsti]KAF9873984.1 MFS monosaccharide transporter [Colletotrichum karsti]
MGHRSPSASDVEKTSTNYGVSTEQQETVLSDASLEPYGPSGFRGIFASHYVAMCAAFSAIGGLLFGYDQGVISVTLVMDQFLERFPEVSDHAAGSGFKKGLMTAMITLGAFIGALNQGWIADWLSRKRSIMVAVVVFTIGSAIQTSALNYDMLVGGRFIGGLGIGMLSMVVPLYISEISPPEIRGSLLVFEQLSIVVGIVVSFWITYGTKSIPNHWSWQLPFLIQIIPGLLLGFGAVFLPYSPRWLASKGREEEALHNLSKLRTLPDTDPRVRREWMEIIAEARFQTSVSAERHPNLVGNKDLASSFKLEVVSWTDCFKAGCWKRTQVGVLLMFFQQFVGINALIYYSPTLFETMGLDRNMQLVMSGVLNVVQLIGVLPSLWTMDRFGRRSILLIGSVGMTISHTVIAGLVGVYSHDWPSYQTQGWVSVVFLMIFMFVFGASWGPIPWALPSEVFPSSLRAKGVALSTCSNWINNFIIGLITPPLIQNTGFGTYVFFAVFCLLSLVWVWFCVPETMGKTLEQMDEVFGDRSGSADVAKKNQIFREVVEEHSRSTVSQVVIRFQEGCVKVNGPGYDPTEILSNITPSDFGSSIKTRGMRDLTPGFALPAVATAIAGLAMISSAIGVVKRNRVTPLVTTVLSALSLIFAAAAIGCVFGTFEKIRKAMRNHIILRTTERNGLEYRLSPRYGPCAITLVVACVILLVTTIIAACAWLASIREGRERRRNNVAEKHYSSDYESRASTTADH